MADVPVLPDMTEHISVLIPWLMEQLEADERASAQVNDVGDEADQAVIAETNRKRSMIEAELAYVDMIDNMFSDGSDTAECCGHTAAQISAGECDSYTMAEHLPIIRALAQPYADRPGWHPAWKD